MANGRSAAKQSQAYLFNLAAVGVGGITVLLALFGMRTKDEVTPCSTRYGVATQFSLQRTPGEPASAAELQSRLGGRDWGVAEHGRVIKTPDGPSDLALEVNLPNVPPTGRPSGLGFTWMIADVQPARAACLSYQVMLPKDFAFGAGGFLPGLFGGETAAPPKDGKDIVGTSFGTHIVWAADGSLNLRVATVGGAIAMSPFRVKEPLILGLGRWVSIDQEVVLNSNGIGDGLLRIWVDGQLIMDQAGLAWRATEAGRFRGVDVRAHFSGGKLEPSRPPTATTLRLSPIDVRWN
jgi:hypothetical protein